MRKIVVYDERKRWPLWEVDLDKLNDQIGEIESDGWTVISVQANVHFLGQISSFTLLIEKADATAVS